MDKLAPVVIFVYARPEHTKKMLESLSNNILSKDTEVFVFSDNAKNDKKIKDVQEVRKIIHEYESKKRFKNFVINEAQNNKGLAKSVITGVTEIINKYDRVIVLEDDLVTSKYFLKYMNDALNFYQDDNSIWSISGYNLPIEISKDYENDVYLSYRGCSWGWATWKDRWNTVDWNVSDYKQFKNSYNKRKKFNMGGNDLAHMLDTQMNGLCDSWAIRWCYEQSKQDKYTIYPVKSLIQNIGLDGSGTHSGNSVRFNTELLNEYNIKFSRNLELNKTILKIFKKMFDQGLKQKILEVIMILRMDKIFYKYEKWRKSRR